MMRFGVMLGSVWLVPWVAFAQAAAEAASDKVAEVVTSPPIALDPVIVGVQALMTIGNEYGWKAASSLSLIFLVNIFRLSISPLLPAKAQWEAWPKWVKMTTIGVLAFVGILLFGIFVGAGALMSVPPAIGIALGAIGMYEVGDALAQLLDKLLPGLKDTAIRKALAILLPLPIKKDAA